MRRPRGAASSRTFNGPRCGLARAVPVGAPLIGARFCPCDGRRSAIAIDEVPPGQRVSLKVCEEAAPRGFFTALTSKRRVRSRRLLRLVLEDAISSGQFGGVERFVVGSEQLGGGRSARVGLCDARRNGDPVE